jgi:hypothetical protein
MKQDDDTTPTDKKEMTMATQSLRDQIAAVNAYADYLAAGHIPSLRDKEGHVLKQAALTVLEAAQDWPTLEKRDGQHLVLEAPDGTRVLYSYENQVERLSLDED